MKIEDKGFDVTHDRHDFDVGDSLFEDRDIKTKHEIDL